MPDSLVIVLDPGHGGSNEGLKHRGLLEKDMNLVTANAMRDELLQYDNVEVYITNPEKADMSLKERAQYAESVGADILISLHFNMSEKHEMYGSEVWIPSRGLNNSKMHGLGDVFMEQFAEAGFALRGVKTRLNDDGLDYYGILRESTALGIQSILVEHGYADHEMDYEKVNDREDWQALGRSDATAVAKYFGLTSSTLGRDFSDYAVNGYHAPEEAVGNDLTEPEGAVLVHLASDEQGELFNISAYDDGSEIVYYDYSTDGGKTWSQLFSFANEANSAEVYITGITPGSEVCARVYNGHFLYTRTNSVFYEAEEFAAQDAPEEQKDLKEDMYVAGDVPTEDYAGTAGQTEAVQPTSQSSAVPMYFGLMFLVFAILLMVTAFATYKERMRLRHLSREERKAGFLPLRRLQQIEHICLVAGVCASLAGITIFGVSYAGKIGQKQQTELVSGMVKSDGNRATVAADENVSSEEHGDEMPKEDAELTIDSERTEGYVMSQEGKLVPGEKLLAQLSYNEEAAQPPETVTVYDMAEGYLRVPLVEGIAENPYDVTAFSGSDLQMDYNAGDGVKIMRGIDVSKFQGDVDWQQVREAGVEFVMLRLGIRGYGTGEMKMDDRFYENYQGATQAGMKVGVYFFSAAINEEEAVEEADYVLRAVSDCVIEMPVVFDTEPIFYDDARTDDLTPNQLTAITKAFCGRIRSAGYEPMIYTNAKRFTTVLQLEELEEYDKWLADYRSAPDYPYAFKMWQFTEKGTVPGISGNVDMNLYFYEE
nr:N-acetylmuramoyl-L-alanine amidase [Lachnospiraceae bacterium]